MTSLRFTRRDDDAVRRIAPACAPFARSAAPENQVRRLARQRRRAAARTSPTPSPPSTTRSALHQTKKYVAIKVNNVSTSRTSWPRPTPTPSTASSTTCSPATKCPVNSRRILGRRHRWWASENFSTNRGRGRSARSQLIDLNREGKYQSRPDDQLRSARPTRAASPPACWIPTPTSSAPAC